MHTTTYRGAGLGFRSTIPDAPPSSPFNLRRIRLDCGGYAPDGTYWGRGAPLYHAMSDDADLYFRAVDRDHAKDQVRRVYPTAEFWR